MLSISFYYGEMELRHLRSFEAIVRCGGFTRAAAELHLAQPVVSAHIKRLEQDLGVTLLHRSRKVSLSAAGESFLPSVFSIFLLSSSLPLSGLPLFLSFESLATCFSGL